MPSFRTGIFGILNLKVFAGGGAEEAALSVYLENLVTTLGSREQLISNCYSQNLC
ncbi:hypothetical protein BRADI_1g49756v3 [Brachypodium distachyon]|uniref:Uncharacterized protein n=1 Tax=Brachypodium distachyon TaxID=15368 RepID=A0A0Q3K579_BRADI|nr:hypothetical protein BRADI_1g49756v3 [Brachypodium distachyon]